MTLNDQFNFLSLAPLPMQRFFDYFERKCMCCWGEIRAGNCKRNCQKFEVQLGEHESVSEVSNETGEP